MFDGKTNFTDTNPRFYLFFVKLLTAYRSLRHCYMFINVYVYDINM